MTVLITGGLGFIGSAVVRRLLATTDAVVVNLDRVTYAASPESLGAWLHDRRHVHLRADICDAEAVRAAFAAHRKATSKQEIEAARARWESAVAAQDRVAKTADDACRPVMNVPAATLRSALSNVMTFVGD